MTTATAAVLFCDLVDSTQRLTRLGDTAADEFRHRFFERLRSACESNGGTVIKNLGDGLMVVFEHSTIGAVDCAARMHRCVADLDPAHPARLRIGISVGEVSHEEGDWFGTPVVEAARLCAAAEPEQTLATLVVRTLIGSRSDSHTFSPVGAMELKGLAAPVDVVAVDGAAPPSPPDRGAARRTGDRAPGPTRPDHPGGRRRMVAGGVAVAVAAAAVTAGWWVGRDGSESGSEADADTTSAAVGSTPEGYRPEFRAVDCPAEVTAQTPDATCGRLIVPELRSEPDGRRIGVDVVRSPARSTPVGPPVFILDPNEQAAATSLGDVSDVYAVTTRGLSPADDPQLECEEIREAWTASFALPADALEGIETRVAAVETCAARLRGAGVQLEGYNMVEAALDLRDLALALGLDEVSVAASEFSTTAAVEFARSSPGLVASLLLTNPTPPGQSTLSDPARFLWESFDRVNELCAADPGCDAAFGDLEISYEQRFDDLETSPRSVDSLPLGADGTVLRVLLDGRRLSAALAAAITSTGQLGYVPTAVATPVTAEQLVASAAIDRSYRLFVAPEVANATVLSFVCAYDGSRPRSAALSSAALRAYVGADEPAIDRFCRAWDVPSIFDQVATPLSGDLPVFIAQGGLSIAGVNDWAELMDRSLNRATIARFPTMSEDLVFSAPKCLRNLRRDFLADPDAELDVASCEQQSPPIEFVGAG